jgi:predicted permease
MSVLSRTRSWIRSIRHRDRIDADLHRELTEWVEELAARYAAEGATPDAARRRALIETEGIERVKDAVRDAQVGASLDALALDLRYTWRMWRRYPWLTGAAILSLALGMGANTAVFSVMHALLLKSAPVFDPGSLIAVYSTSAANPGWHQTSFKNYEDLREALPIEALAYAAIPVGMSTAGNQAEQVPTEIVSGNYFELLGVRAAVGRTFAYTAAEDKLADKHPEIVISDVLWKRWFGSRTDVLNQTIQLNARPFTIVGVAPPAFHGLDVMRAVDVWVPASNTTILTGVSSFYFRNRSIGMFDVVARMTSTEGLQTVQPLLQVQASKLAQLFPQDNRGLSFATRPFWQAQMNPAQRDTWVRAGGLLAVVVGLVLLIACANVANLQLARSVSRRREVAVRLAIGATRQRLIRQLLLESLMLSSVGALVGLGVAWGAVRMLSALRPAFVPASFDAPLDGNALLFTGVVAFLIGPLFGLLPAMQASRANVVDGLKSEEVRQRTTRRDFSLALLVAQSTLATVALILASLFVRSLRQAQEINLGFDADHVAIVSFDLGMLRYDNAKGPAFIRRVNDRLRTVPGVISSAVASHVLLDGAGLAGKITLAGHEDAEALSVEAGAVGLDYFRTMKIPVIAGRGFQESDAAAVSEFGWAVVNQTMAEQLWPGRQAVGQRFHVLGIKEPYVVVGVVSDARYDTLGERRRPYFYIYYDQAPGLKKLTLHVLTAGDPRRLLPAIQAEIQASDPNLPLIKARTMSDVLRDAMWVPRTGAALLLAFGSIALSLAVIGIYGVTAFFLRQRRREIGIRLALGATAANILFMVVRRILAPTAIGLVLGLVASYLGGRLVASLLIGVGPTDPKSFATAVVVLAVAAAAACVLPAFAAMRMDPALVLRRE